MSDDVHARLKYLEDRLEIQDLRHRYWLANVQKDLESIVSCYAGDAHSEFGHGFDLHGRDAVRAFYAKHYAREDLIVQVPLGTNGLVEFTDAMNAKGSWLINVSLVRRDVDYGVRNTVRYEERYRIEDGSWKICYQKTHYLFWETIQLREGM